MHKIAVFDFDGTLTCHDTYITFARHALGMPRLLFGCLRSLPWLVAWKAGLIRGGRAKERLTRCLYRGMPVDEFKSRCSTFADVIETDLRDDIMGRLRALQTQGVQTAIVSASVDMWIKPWAERHGIETVLSTQLEVDAYGRLTGRFDTPNCYGEEKVRRMQRHFGDLTAYEITAFGDSKGGDGAMLGVADHAVWV